MTFAKAIKILNLLDHDKTIVVKESCDYESDENEYDCDYMRQVDRFSKYDEIGEYIKYFTDSYYNKYHFYILEDDDFCSDDEIEDD